jgi:DNA-binding MarR family transcriptional regulator
MSLTRVSTTPTWLLGRANARAQGLLAAAFDPFGLRPLQYRALAALEEHGELSQAELGRRLTMDRKDVSVAVDLLGERRLVERRADPKDRRRTIVALTNEGRALLPRLHAALGAAQEAVVAPLTAREAAELTKLLAKLGAGDPAAPAAPGDQAATAG